MVSIADQCACAEETGKVIDLALLQPELERFTKEPGTLIPLLQATQELYGYLPKEALAEIARARKVPLSTVWGVATFYTQFHMNPRGDVIVRVCQGTACHVRGADEVMDAVSDELDVEVGKTAGDLSVTLESVSCVGCCGLAPVAVVDEQMHGNLDARSARRIAKSVKRNSSR